MTTITQTIPNYVSGISEQPDELKTPGQVTVAENVLPDVTQGLIKRPGGQLIGNGLSAFTEASKWFHYYRDEDEQYIGQIKLGNGELKMWRCSDGQEYNETNNKITFQSGKETEIKNYLKQTNTATGTITDSDLQTLTLNDYTYITNRNKAVAMSSTVETNRPPEAFIELKKVAYASQYSVNLFDDSVTDTNEITTATRIEVERLIDTSNGCQGNQFNKTDAVSNYNSGSGNNVCGDGATGVRNTIIMKDSLAGNTGTELFSGIGSGVTYKDIDQSHTVEVRNTDESGVKTDRKNLYFRITTNGQAVPNNAENISYSTRYTTTHDLLYGGEGWKTNDYFYVWMKNAYYKITILEHSRSEVRANLGLVRPTPTPFDTETTITAESVLGDIRSGIYADAETGNNFTGTLTEIIGNGIYIKRRAKGTSGVATYTGTFSAASTTATITISGGHSLEVGQEVFLKFTNHSSGDYPETGDKTVITKDATTFTVNIPQIASGTITGDVEVQLQIGTNPFQITTPVTDLLNVFTDSIKDVSDLPSQCKHGYVVKVANSEADEDDYYLKFIGKLAEDGTYLDGEGVWEECAKPGINIEMNPATMPIQIVRQADDTFKVEQITWENRLVGDEVTVPEPSFVGKSISKMLFFRNRLVMLSDENVIMSRPGDFFNFWPKSAITYTATDNIDLSCSSEYPAVVYDGLQINSGLVLFTKNQQFMLTTDSDVLSPLTAKINSLSSYNFNFKTNPLSLGTTIAFLDNAGKYTRFWEMSSVFREGEPNVLEQSKSISQSLPSDLNMVANSRENQVIFFGEKGTKKLYGFRYHTTAAQRIQQAWFHWNLNGEIQHIAMLDDALFAIVKTNDVYTIQRFSIRGLSSSFELTDDQATTSDTTDDISYRVHLDNSVKQLATGITYNTITGESSFSKPSGFGTDSTRLAVISYDDNNSSNEGRYSAATIDGSNIKINGDWSGNVSKITITNKGSGYTSAPTVTISGGGGTNATATATIKDGEVDTITITNPGINYTSVPTITISGDATATAVLNGGVIVGYDFEMKVQFPTIYLQQQNNEQYRSLIHNSLVVHRVKFSLGPSGNYTTTLERLGKPDYIQEHESPLADSYTAGHVAVNNVLKKIVPIYEKNTNLTLTLKSTHPTPATLYSMTWEGDYTDKFYKSV